MCASKLELWIYLQVEKLRYLEPRKKPEDWKIWSRFCELPSVIQSFMLVTDNVRGLNEAFHVVTTTFQRLLWQQLGCLILGNYLIGLFTVLFLRALRDMTLAV